MLTSVTNWLFSPGGLSAHGFCLLWEPWLIWTQATADFAVGLAYFTIPAALAVYARKRADLTYRPVLWLFAAFILLCGAGHFIELLTLWVPAYRLQSIVKAATGIVSVITAAAIWKLMPNALAMPSSHEMQSAAAAIRYQQGVIDAMIKSHQLLRNMVEASPTALVLTGEDGNIAMVNANTEKLFGYGRAELQDKPLETLLPAEFRSRHVHLRTGFMNNMSSRAMAEGRELHGLRKDGTTFPLEIGLSPIEIDGQRMVLAGINDITVRRDSQRAVEDRRQALEQSNGELIRARLRAEQATRAKSRFLAGMSHELRTPLNGIIGYAEILEMEGGLNPQQTGRIDAMRAAGSHLLGMITRILDLSEIEAGRITIAACPVDIRSLARDCVSVVEPAASARKIPLHLDADPAMPEFILADPVRLRQILLNLLGNAIKFTDSGSVHFRLHCAASAPAAARLRIEIADTGRGIPADRRASLFRDFERLGADPDRAVEGSGLGLAISARIAAMMDGNIEHRDNPGGGSVFSFEMPLRLITEADPAPAGLADEPQQPPAGAAGPANAAAPTVAPLPATNGTPPAAAFTDPADVAALPPGAAGEARPASLPASLPAGSPVAEAMAGRSGEAEPRDGTDAADAADRAQGGKSRVLVVDDVAINRDIASYFLRAAGHRVACATSGKDAVEIARSTDLDIVLMDLSMPGMDGFEATREIHAIGGARGRVPVVAVTAHAFPEHVEECRRAGMVGHVAKPFTQATLLAAIRIAQGALMGEATEPQHLIIDLDTFETAMAYLPPEKSPNTWKI